MRILQISPNTIWPVRRHGAAQRTELLRRALSEHADVDCIGLTVETAEAEAVRKLDPGFPLFMEEPHDRTVRPGWLAKFRQELEDQRTNYAPHSQAEIWVRDAIYSGRYDVVVTRYLRSATLAGLGRTVTQIPWLLDMDDVRWMKVSREPITSGHSKISTARAKLARALSLRHLERLSRGFARRAHAIWVPSLREQRGLSPLRATVLPNIPMDPPRTSRPVPRGSKRVLFVGLLDYEPNTDGLNRYIAHSWPIVLESCPDAVLDVVGGGLDEARRRSWSQQPGVKVHGFVEDLEPIVQRSAVTVCPIWQGGGTQIKVLDSLARGRVPIVTPMVAEAFADRLHAEKHLAVGADDGQMANVTIKMLRDAVLRDEMAEAGRQVTSSFYTFKAFSDTVKATMDSLFEGLP